MGNKCFYYLNNKNITLSKKTINTHAILKFEEEYYNLSDDFFNKTLQDVKNVEFNKENEEITFMVISR